MSTPGFVIVPLDAAYSCAAFDCGNEEMNGYARSRLQTEYASRVTGAFALLRSPSTTVMGFYTLSPTEIKATQATAAGMIEQHPYPGVGGALLGRLGVSVALQGQGFGTLLVTHAIKEVCRLSYAPSLRYRGCERRQLVQLVYREMGVCSVRPEQTTNGSASLLKVFMCCLLKNAPGC